MSWSSGGCGATIVLTSSFPADESDYRGRFVLGFAESLSGRVQILTPGVSPLFGSMTRPRETVTRSLCVTRVHRPSGKPFGRLYGGAGLVNNLKSHPTDVRFLPHSWKGMGKALDGRLTESGPGSLPVVIAHWLLPFGLLAAQHQPRWGYPLWIVCHSGGVRLFASAPAPVRRWIASLLWRARPHLSFVTEELRGIFFDAVGDLASRFEPRTTILAMGIDTSRFQNAAPAVGGPIVGVGRLTHLKGFDRLLEAIALTRPTASVRLIGDGPARSGLERLARQLRLNVDFAGQISPDRLPGLLNNASVAVLPSRRLNNGRCEGFPTTILEYLAAGLPTLCTRTWGIPEAWTSSPGFVAVDDSTTALAHGLDSVLDHRISAPDVSARRQLVSDADWRCVGGRIRGFCAQVRVGSGATVSV